MCPGPAQASLKDLSRASRKIRHRSDAGHNERENVMSLESTLVQDAVPGSTEPATRTRITAVCAVLALTGLASIPMGLLWPGGSNSGTVLTVEDVASYRQTWWVLIMSGAVLTSLNVPAQAVAVLTLVRDKGAKAATWGAGLMWVGAVMESVGLAGFAAAYFYPSDPAVSDGAGADVFSSIANDHAHLLAIQLPGHLLMTIGIVVQAVALFRSKAVPKWLPVISLSILVTYVIPGSHLIGLVTQLPLAATCLGLACYARRRVT
jgi:hypothetical protein